MFKNSILACLMVVLFFGVSQLSSAQECEAYFPVEEGAVRVMDNYDKKEKLSSTTKQLVAKISETDEGTVYVVEQWSFDKKGKETGFHELNMICQEGVFFVDMKDYIDPAMMASVEDMEVTVDSKDLIIPSTMEVGQQLEDGSIRVTGTNMGIPMINIYLEIYNRKVEALEKITTPAGTFECYLITQDMKLQSFFKAEFKLKEWMAAGVGVVRSETYDSKGKPMGYSILKEFK